MTPPLVIIGSVAVDTIRTPHKDVADTLGGSASFAALTARHWGQTLVLSAIGPDFPKTLLDKLTDAGIDTRHLTRAKTGKTFRWEGIYDETLGTRETLGFDLGVMATEKLTAPKNIQEAKFVMMGNYHPSRQLEIIPSLNTEAFIAADTIRGWIQHEREGLGQLFAKSHLVCIDNDELKEFTGAPDEAAGVRKLQSVGPQWVIVKHGKKGSQLYGKAGPVSFVGIYPNEPKDTTGAGDTYLGAIMAHLNEQGRVTEETLTRGMIIGSAAASITTEAFGVDCIITATKEEILRRAAGVER